MTALSYVPVDVPAMHRLRQAVSQSIVHERDRLEARVAELEFQLGKLAAGRRSFREIRCDNCPATLTVSSSTELSEEAMRIALSGLCWNARWGISQATADELRVRSTSHTRDLCPSCLGGAK